MKILVVVYNFLSPSMTFIFNQVTELEKEHEVHVVACERNNSHLFPFVNLKILPFRKLDSGYLLSLITRKLGLEFNSNSTSYLKAISKEITLLKPEIIHVHFGLQLIRLAPLINNSSAQFIVTFHGYDASQLLRNKLYVKKLRAMFAKKNVWGTTVSFNMKERLVKEGLPENKLFVDYLGVDTDFFRPGNEHKKNSAHYSFLQISNFIEKKGHEFTLRAFADFIKSRTIKDCRLVLAGDGPLLEPMKALCGELEISKYVDFPGLVDKHGVKELMEQAHYFVHHSIVASDGDSEGIPTVLMEAMSMGLPVLSTFHSGIPELVRDNTDGILRKERDIESFSKAFGEMIGFNSPNSSSRQRVVENFNLVDNTHHIEKIFRSLRSD